MIGDWVYNCIANIKFQVYPRFFSQWHNRPEQFVATIQPIPITPEILERNGWKSMKNGSGDFILTKPFVGNSATITKTINGYEMSHGAFNGMSIHYIHQLQHALRLCGIEKEIEL